MKKYFILLFVIMCLPLMVHAESKYLYDVLKNEAESGGLAKEYTGQHHDSFTEEPTHKIYHWYTDVYYKGNEIIEKNNVIFAGFCWQIIRTTDTGGVKLIYNGVEASGKCNNKGESTSIGKSAFNEKYNSLSYSGYMYNSDNVIIPKYGRAKEDSTFGSDFIYENSMYKLINIVDKYDNSHHYTCGNIEGKCDIIKYFFDYPYGLNNVEYIEINNNAKIEQILSNMHESNKNNSTIKNKIDMWYENNLLKYSNYIEDTVYCNNRNVSSYYGWNSNGGFGCNLNYESYQNSNNLLCKNEYDKYSINNSNAELSYPIGLPTVNEVYLYNEIVRNTDINYWLISPYSVYGFEPTMYYVCGENNNICTKGGLYHQYVDYEFYVRPVISLKKEIKYKVGEGSKDNPYKIYSYYSVGVKAVDETKNLNIEISDLTHVEYGEEVKFNVTPIKGYKVNELKILDSDNKEIEYRTIGNTNEYTFIMPASDVTIIPSYEKVSNAVNIEENKNTKEIIIEVNDAKAVVYEDIVKFTVVPEEGYELINIEIIDEDGNSITYTKTDKDNEYEFLMPDTDVMINPIYKKIEQLNVPDTLKNPNTGDKVFLIILLMLLCLGIGTIIYKRKNLY